MDVSALARYRNQRVVVALRDGSQFRGVLRTELLSERSVAVFIQARDDAGERSATLYLDDIDHVCAEA